MKNIFLIVLVSTLLFSNNNLVDTIIVSGNKNTKEYVIRREILHPNNQVLDSLLLKEDINRLYNLGIFSTVDIQVENNIYHINVVESFSILPDLVIDYSEITKKWSYGLGLAHINFLGLNQQLYLGGAFIGEKWFAISLNNPWVYGDHISLKSILYNKFGDNPFYNYRFNATYFLLETGFYNGLNNKFEFGLSYYKNKKHTSSELLPLSEKNIYRYLNTEFNYQYDTRDVYKDPLKGSLFNFNARYSKSLIKDNSNVSQFSFSFQQFFLLTLRYLHEAVISYNISGLFKFPKFSKLPIHEYEYLGGEDFVRGYSSFPDKFPDNFGKNIEVSNIIYSHLELQSTILKKKDYGKIEFGIDGLLFINSGIGSKSIDIFSFDNFLIGYGFGFKFFITGPPPISIMFGYNPYGQKFMHLEN
tara:strand:- start:6190 stop:7437 length:1248 start_codon:yes stop_codon:yes gene_type:complete